MPSGNCFICTNNRRLSVSSYFSFPVDAQRKQDWCTLLGLDIRTISKNTVICERHFSPQQFVNKHRLRLRQNALPIPANIGTQFCSVLPTLTPVPVTRPSMSTTTLSAPVQAVALPVSQAQLQLILTKQLPALAPKPTTATSAQANKNRTKPLVTPIAPKPKSSSLLSNAAVGAQTSAETLRLCPPQSSRAQTQVTHLTSLTPVSLAQSPSVLFSSTPTAIITQEKAASTNELALMKRTVRSLLAWIRTANGNSLPEEVVKLIPPLLQPEALAEMDARSEIKMEVESENEEDLLNVNDATADSSELKLVDLSTILDAEPNAHVPLIHKCPYCNQDFESLVELSKHSLTHCFLPLRRLREKYVQRRRVRLDGSLSASSTRRSRLKTKLRRKKPLKPQQYNDYPCPVCAHNFHNREKMSVHVRREHPGSYAFTCSTCGQGFKSLSSFRQHLRDHDPKTAENQTSPCSICGKTFARLFYLTKHMTYTHAEERKYKCSYCPSTFKTSNALKSHVDRHLQRNQRQCPHCGCFKDPLNLKKHIETVHEGKRFKCKVCGLLQYSASLLREHFLVHHEDSPASAGLSLSDCFTVTHVDVVGEKRRKVKRKSGAGQSSVALDSKLTRSRSADPESEESVTLACPALSDSASADTQTPKSAPVHPASGQQENKTSKKRRVRFVKNPKRKFNFPTTRCEVCNVLISVTSLAQHLSLIHGGDARYRHHCNFCSSDFSTSFHLQNHFYREHATKRVQPDLNPENPPTASPPILKSVPTKCTINQHVCKLCNNHAFKKKFEWKVHLAKHKKDPDYRLKPRLPVCRIDRPATASSNDSQSLGAPDVDMPETENDAQPDNEDKACTGNSAQVERPAGDNNDRPEGTCPADTALNPTKSADTPASLLSPSDSCQSPPYGHYLTKDGKLKRIKKRELKNYSCPYDSCHQTSTRWATGTKLKQHLTTAHPEFTGFGRKIWVDSAKPVKKKHGSRVLGKKLCPHCGKLITAYNFIRHVKYVHAAPKASPFECKICDKSFQHELYLRNHEKTIAHRKLLAGDESPETKKSKRSK